MWVRAILSGLPLLEAIIYRLFLITELSLFAKTTLVDTTKLNSFSSPTITLSHYTSLYLLTLLCARLDLPFAGIFQILGHPERGNALYASDTEHHTSIKRAKVI